MIEVSGLTKVYNNTKVVDDVSFRVEKGEILVLLGTSGSGKTTTLKMINKLVDRSSGQVMIAGKNTDDITPFHLRRNIGYVIQNTGLFPHYTIFQNIATVPHLLGWKTEKVNNVVIELMKTINLPQEMLKRYPAQLSGGQQQRVGIARALAADPDVILLDEPFGALDPITRADIQQEFKKLNSSLKKTMVLVTHDIMEAVLLGDKIAIMNKGKVIQLGTPFDIVFKPKTEFVRKFFGQQRLQLELNIIKVDQVNRFIQTHKYQASDSQKTIAEYLQENETTDLLETYLSNRDKMFNQ